MPLQVGFPRSRLRNGDQWQVYEGVPLGLIPTVEVEGKKWKRTEGEAGLQHHLSKGLSQPLKDL